MDVLVLNRISHSKAPYEGWLNDPEIKLTLLTSDQKMEEFNKFKGYREIQSIPNYDYGGLLEKTAVDLVNRIEYQAIIAISELDLIRAAKLREKFSIKGQTTKSAVAFRDKLVMKDIASQAPIKIPHYQKIESALDLLDFIGINGYPVVVKPIDGSGSVNTDVLRNDTDLESFLLKDFPSDLMAEQYIEGDMYHIDGLIVKGKIVIIWPSKYINGCLAFKEGYYLGSHLLDNQNPLAIRLIEKVQELLKAFPTPENTTFHAEIFHTSDDELYFCEIASRTGGGPIKDVILQAFGMDITKLWIQAQCNLNVDIPQSNGKLLTPKVQTGFVLIPPRKGVFMGVDLKELPEWVDDYKLLATKGQSFNNAQLSIDHIASFRVQGSSEKDVFDKIQSITDLFNRSVKWE